MSIEMCMKQESEMYRSTEDNDKIVISYICSNIHGVCDLIQTMSKSKIKKQLELRLEEYVGILNEQFDNKIEECNEVDLTILDHLGIDYVLEDKISDELKRVKQVGIKKLDSRILLKCIQVNDLGNIFEMTNNYYNLRAKGRLNADGTFTVFKGSTMVYLHRGKDYDEVHIKNLNKYKDVLRDVEGRYFTFIEDVTFSNVTRATECLKGYTGINGTPWKNINGTGIYEYIKKHAN